MRCDPTRFMASSFLKFLDHTHRHTTVGRTPLDEWSARRRDLYLTTRQHSQQTNIHAPSGIRTHNLSRRAAAELCLRPRGHWDRQCLRLWVRNKNRAILCFKKNTLNILFDAWRRYFIFLFQLDSFRFSIAWTRIMPTGTINSLNQEGIDFYNSVINELIKNGITPMVRFSEIFRDLVH